MNEPIDGPEDWRELAKLPVAELMAQRFAGGEPSAKTAWRNLIWAIPRIRALKEHVGGLAFEEHAMLLTGGYTRTLSYKIVTSGIAELPVLTAIWERVHRDVHVADVRCVAYRHPGLQKMLDWCRQLNMEESDDEIERRILREIEPYWRRDQRRRDQQR